MPKEPQPAIKEVKKIPASLAHLPPKYTDGPFRVVLSDQTYRLGDVVRGMLVLNNRLCHNDNLSFVEVKLKGKLRTSVSHSNGQSRSTSIQKFDLVVVTANVWTRNTNYVAGNDVVEIPFQLQLPTNGLPSFDPNPDRIERASVIYKIKAVGHRPGLLSFSRKTECCFTVVRPDNPGKLIRRRLSNEPWSGAWSTYHKSGTVAAHFWKTKCPVDITFKIPDIPTLVCRISLPFQLTISTESTLMDRLANPLAQAIFPKPCETSTRYNIGIFQMMWFKARGHTKRRTNELYPFPAWAKIKSRDTPCMQANEVEKIVYKPEKNKGLYMQKVSFNGVLHLGYFPEDVDHERVRINYYVHISVPFEGGSAKKEANFAVKVSSGC